MDVLTIEKKFSKMGAKVEFEDPVDRARVVRTFEEAKRHPEKFEMLPTFPSPKLDIVHRGKEEVFVLETFGNPKMKVEVLDLRPDKRHLLLMLKDEGQKGNAKYLCGHDERHWFVAAIPEAAGAKNVADAMEALKPEVVRQSQKKKGVKAKHRNKRKNAGFIRQGEWFFIPEPSLIDVPAYAIHRKEPISRARGASHICEEVYRSGGRTVYVHSQYAKSGLSQSAFDRFIKANPEKRDNGWQRMIEGATVFARGYVKQFPDHKTIHLNGWHRVEMNLEHKARAMEWVRFFD
jgi:hypothetical protein